MQSKLNMDDLLKESSAIVNWIKDDSGVWMASAPSKGIEWLAGKTMLLAAIAEISLYRKANPINAMLNDVPAGITVPIHRDFLAPIHGVKNPIVERWHLPILTNDKCLWWDEHNFKEGEEAHMPVGVWSGPVLYWLHHAVKNLGMTNRIHLVVDLDLTIPDEKYE